MTDQGWTQRDLEAHREHEHQLTESDRELDLRRHFEGDEFGPLPRLDDGEGEPDA